MIFFFFFLIAPTVTEAVFALMFTEGFNFRWFIPFQALFSRWWFGWSWETFILTNPWQQPKYQSGPSKTPGTYGTVILMGTMSGTSKLLSRPYRKRRINRNSASVTSDHGSLMKTVHLLTFLDISLTCDVVEIVETVEVQAAGFAVSRVRTLPPDAGWPEGVRCSHSTVGSGTWLGQKTLN